MPKVRDRLDYPHFYEINEAIVDLVANALKNVGYSYSLDGSNRGKAVQHKSEGSAAVQMPHFRVFLNRISLDNTSLKVESFKNRVVTTGNDEYKILEYTPIPYMLDYTVEVVSDRYDDYLRILQALSFHIIPRGYLDVETNSKTENEQLCTLKYRFGSHNNLEARNQFRSRFTLTVCSFISQGTIDSIKTIKTVDVKDCIFFYLDEESFEAGGQ